MVIILPQKMTHIHYFTGDHYSLCDAEWRHFPIDVYQNCDLQQNSDWCILIDPPIYQNMHAYNMMQTRETLTPEKENLKMKWSCIC